MMSFTTARRMHGLLKLKMFIAQYFSSESTRFQLSDYTSLRSQYINMYTLHNVLCNKYIILLMILKKSV